MSRSRPLACARLLALIALVALPAPGLAAAPGPPPELDPYQLLNNPGLESYEAPYGEFEGVPCQLAAGWQRYWLDGAEPYWMDARVFAASHLGCGWVERIEGETSQLIFATQPYTAGIRQSVAVTPGLGYGFHAAMLTIFETSAQPPQHNTMVKRVGIDPTGGTDPLSPAVVWAETDGQDQGPWRIDLRTAVFAEAPTMTVFIDVASPYAAAPGLLNISFLDSAILARTPSISATSPAVSDLPTFDVSWDNAVPAPGGVALKWRDVQWLDEAEGLWHDWLTETYAVEAPFGGQWGHTYRFRARVWQKYENGAHLASPYRAAGDTRTAVPGSRLVGRVRTHDGRPLGGATVAAPGTPFSTLSGGDGRYELGLAPNTAPEVLTVSHPRHPAPPGLYGLSFGVTDTLPFTWTLRPRDDRVANGQFEGSLDGWDTLGLAPIVVADPVHTGLGAAKLSGPPDVAFLSGLSQTVALTRTWAPALSLWYNPAGTAAGDHLRITVQLTGETLEPREPITYTGVYTPALDAPGWVRVALPAGPPEAFVSGRAALQFEYRHRLDGRGPASAPVLVLDEIALGASAGGPYGVYLPAVVRCWP